MIGILGWIHTLLGDSNGRTGACQCQMKKLTCAPTGAKCPALGGPVAQRLEQATHNRKQHFTSLSLTCSE